MSSHDVVGAPPLGAPQSTAEVVPFYVCPGAREVPVGYTVFPYGGSIDTMVACPAREICAWYAAHDLGETVAYNDQPEARLLPAVFKTGPFSCAHFRDYDKMLRQAAKAKAKQVGRPAAKGRCAAACSQSATADTAPATAGH